MIFRRTNYCIVLFLLSCIDLEASLFIKDISNKPVAVEGIPYFIVPSESRSCNLALKGTLFSFEKDKLPQSFFWFSKLIQRIGYSLKSGSNYGGGSTTDKNCLLGYCKKDEAGFFVVKILLLGERDLYLGIKDQKICFDDSGETKGTSFLWILIPAYPIAEYLKKEPGTFCSLPFSLPQREQLSGCLIDQRNLKALIELQVEPDELDFCEHNGDTFFCRLKGGEVFCLSSSSDCILFIENLAHCLSGVGEDYDKARTNARNINLRNNADDDDDEELGGESQTLFENRFLYYKPNGVEGWKKFLLMTIDIGFRKIPSGNVAQGLFGYVRQAVGAVGDHPIVKTGEVVSLAQKLPHILQKTGMALGPDFLIRGEKIQGVFHLRVYNANRNVVSNPGNAAFLGELAGKNLVQELKLLTDQLASTSEELGAKVERASNTVSDALEKSSREFSSVIFVSTQLLESSIKHASNIFETAVITLKSASREVTGDLRKTALLLSDVVLSVSADLKQNLALASQSLEQGSHEASNGLKEAADSFSKAFQQISQDLKELGTSSSANLESAIRAFKEGTDKLASAARKVKVKHRLF